MGGTDFFDDDLIQKRAAGRSQAGSPAASTVIAGSDELPAKAVSDLNLTRIGRYRDEAGAQVANTVQELETLRRRQEELEREKRLLEDLTRQQDDYENGRRDLHDRLTQAAAMLEKHELHASRLVELYATNRTRFREMLDELRGINEESWDDASYREEMSRALASMDEMRKEYGKAMARIEAAEGGGPLSGSPAAALAPAEAAERAEPRGLVDWMKVGFAFSLPLMVFILACLTVAWLVYVNY